MGEPPPKRAAPVPPKFLRGLLTALNDHKGIIVMKGGEGKGEIGVSCGHHPGCTTALGVRARVCGLRLRFFRGALPTCGFSTARARSGHGRWDASNPVHSKRRRGKYE